VENIFGPKRNALYKFHCISKCHPFSLIFYLGSITKSQGAKFEQGGWGTITMSLLVTNSVVFGGHVGGQVVMIKEQVQIFC
jgi:hypothetical protein